MVEARRAASILAGAGVWLLIAAAPSSAVDLRLGVDNPDLGKLGAL